MYMYISVVIGSPVAVSLTPNVRTYGSRPSCQMPTIAPGVEARSMAAGIALSNTAARSSAALGALNAAKRAIANAAIHANALGGKVGWQFRSFPGLEE